MSDLEFPPEIEKLACELGFFCSIDSGVYCVEHEEHDAHCKSSNAAYIGSFLLGFKCGVRSCDFTAEWALRDMG